MQSVFRENKLKNEVTINKQAIPYGIQFSAQVNWIDKVAFQVRKHDYLQVRKGSISEYPLTKKTMQKRSAAEIITDNTNSKDSIITSRQVLLTRGSFVAMLQDWLERVKFAGNWPKLCLEIRQERWQMRDTWLQDSLKVEAIKNGLLADHFIHFTDLFDAVIVKALLEQLDAHMDVEEEGALPADSHAQLFPILSLIQLIFAENERVMCFFLLKPVLGQSSTLQLLVEFCPIVKKCIVLLTDAIIQDGLFKDSLAYYCKFVSLLACKYPTKDALELCKIFLSEIGPMRALIQPEQIKEIFNTFPFISLPEFPFEAFTHPPQIKYSNKTSVL